MYKINLKLVCFLSEIIYNLATNSIFVHKKASAGNFDHVVGLCCQLRQNSSFMDVWGGRDFLLSLFGQSACELVSYLWYDRVEAYPHSTLYFVKQSYYLIYL